MPKNNHSDGSIRHHKDGRIEKRLHLGGKRYSVYGQSIKEVQAKAKALERDHALGRLVTIDPAAAKRLEEHRDRQAHERPDHGVDLDLVFPTNSGRIWDGPTSPGTPPTSSSAPASRL